MFQNLHKSDQLTSTPLSSSRVGIPIEEDRPPHVKLAPLLKGYYGRAERRRKVSWRVKDLRRPEAELVHCIGSAPQRKVTGRPGDQDRSDARVELYNRKEPAVQPVTPSGVELPMTNRRSAIWIGRAAKPNTIRADCAAGIVPLRADHKAWARIPVGVGDRSTLRMSWSCFAALICED